MRASIIFSALVLLFAGSLPAGAIGYHDFATFQRNAGPLTLVNFDTDQKGVILNDGEKLTGRYDSWGVEFGPEDYAGKANGPVSAPNAWYFPGLTKYTTVKLSRNIYAVGVYNVLNNADNGAILSAYDGSDNIIESVFSDYDKQTLDFFGLITHTAIAKIIITMNQPNSGGLDNLNFGSTAIPIPGAVWLLGSGLVGLMVWRRCKKG